jgi:hypothetical protein
MPLSEPQKAELFSGLETRGWTWREAFIYAPQGTMWLSQSLPWGGDLSEFHERMSGRLERNLKMGQMYEDEADHRALVADTHGLVDTLTPPCCLHLALSHVRT